MAVSAVFFDLDGTLVDSLQDLADAVNHMLATFGRPTLTPPKIRQLIGKGARNLVQRALSTDSPEEIDSGLKVFAEFNELHIADHSCLYPGILDTLRKLAANNIRMAVISNKNEALSRLILSALKIDTFFDCIVGGDTFAEMKPSPLPLHNVIATFGIDIKRAIMVGDSINDIQAGNRAGVVTIGCVWGYGTPDELDKADFRATTADGMYQIIASAAEI